MIEQRTNIILYQGPKSKNLISKQLLSFCLLLIRINFLTVWSLTCSLDLLLKKKEPNNQNLKGCQNYHLQWKYQIFHQKHSYTLHATANCIIIVGFTSMETISASISHQWKQTMHSYILCNYSTIQHKIFEVAFCDNNFCDLLSAAIVILH